VIGTVTNKKVALGNKKLMEQEVSAKVSIRKSNYSRTKTRKKVSYSVDGIAVGFVSITDAIKATSVETIKELIRQGVEVIMLTGDNTAKVLKAFEFYKELPVKKRN
jgi:Cu2+-exporting ATPase